MYKYCSSCIIIIFLSKHAMLCRITSDLKSQSTNPKKSKKHVYSDRNNKPSLLTIFLQIIVFLSSDVARKFCSVIVRKFHTLVVCDRVTGV